LLEIAGHSGALSRWRRRSLFVVCVVPKLAGSKNPPPHAGVPAGRGPPSTR
jgi:hypothetical protein